MKRFFFFLAVLYVSTTSIYAHSANSVSFEPPVAGLRLAVKVFLQGVTDNRYGMLNQLPTSQPYTVIGFEHSGTETTTKAILANSFGENSIVDWILLELRDPTKSTKILHSRAALLQLDGDVVDIDGTSPVMFPDATNGNYFVAVRHRNHLGFRTLATHSLSATLATFNFTNDSVPLFGIIPLSQWGAMMIAGDANSDGSIDGVDSGIWEISNGIYAQYQLTADFNLDGSVDATDSAIWEINNGLYSEF